MATLANRLGVAPDLPVPAYEDPWHYVREEQGLPVNIDPLEKDLKDPQQRSTLARLLERGLGEAVGYVLPLKAESKPKRRGRVNWRSASWQFRRKHLFLLPGDSPMGLRLPLKSLPSVSPEDLEMDHGRDPLEEREALADTPIDLDPGNSGAPDRNVKAIEGSTQEHTARKVIRTALCAEARQGRLYILMPPLPYLEEYLELVAAVESTARELQTPVLIEG